jgi:hypothetical protein
MFLQWYQQRFWEKMPVMSWVFKVAGRHQTFWCPLVPKDMIPLNANGSFKVTTKSKLKLKAEPKQLELALKWQCGEHWYLIEGNHLTPDQLGVGPHDWHSSDAIEHLQAEGDPINKEKGPEFTLSQGGKNSKTKRKRSSKKGLRERAKRLYQSPVEQNYRYSDPL